MSHTRELIDIELWVSFQEVISHTRELIDIKLECVGELSGGHESHKRVDKY